MDPPRSAGLAPPPRWIPRRRRMKKSEFASHVASRTSLTRAGAEAAVNAVLTTITDTLAKGDTVTIAGFGTFSTEDATGPSRPQPADRRAHRHPGLDGAVVQGGEDPARRGRLAARENPRQLGKRRDGIADGHSVGGARCGRLSHRHPPRCARSESRPLPNLSHDEALRSHAPGAHRGQLPMRPAPCQVARPDATSRRDVCRREEKPRTLQSARHAKMCSERAQRFNSPRR